MSLLTSLAPSLAGACFGGIVGYLLGHLQWKRTLKREQSVYDRENLRALVEAAYATIEYMSDYYKNSQTMELSAFMSCMTGKNPIKKVLSLVTSSVPELQKEAEALMSAIDTLQGPEYPVPKSKHTEAVAVANKFGAGALHALKKMRLTPPSSGRLWCR